MFGITTAAAGAPNDSMFLEVAFWTVIVLAVLGMGWSYLKRKKAREQAEARKAEERRRASGDDFYDELESIRARRSNNSSSRGGDRMSRSPLDGQFTRAPARKVSSTDVTGKTFADVAGNEEAIGKLKLVQSWLEDPKLFSAYGGRLPKGILLVGPPGTGKTLLVKALAGEGGATLLTISGSDFVEMFVGVGASRVRDLFQQARDAHEDTKKPVIIFIDEIDAVGKRRSGGGPGSNDEREQTLNQLLVEMDGFAPNQGIMLIAATNRVDILDPALKRPGRFDYQIFVDLPDFHAREAIFQVHMRGKPLAAGIDGKLLAARTPGFSGADIEAVCNEAATLQARPAVEAVRQLRKSGKTEADVEAFIKEFVAKNPITLETFSEAIDVVQMGEARESRARVMSLEERKQTAYHEAGHAAVNHVRGGDPVTKITIMPRARSLGHTQATPEQDRFNYTDEQLRTRIMMAMGGRMAQIVFMNTVDTGAASDFQQASSWAKKMVTEFGMSKLGPIYLSEDDMSTLGGSGFFGPELQNEINREWKEILNSAAAEAQQIIRDNAARIEAVVQRLLEKETILGPEFREIWDSTPPNGGSPLPKEFDPSMEGFSAAPAAPAAHQPVQPADGGASPQTDGLS